MKNIAIIVLVFNLFSCQSDKKINEEILVENFTGQNENLVYQVELINELSYPDWLEGNWQNIGESATDNFITYSFNGNKLKISKGINRNETVKFIEHYKGYTLHEHATDNTYLIELKKDGESYEFEFKLQSVEWTDEKVLTYSIVENGNLKREHLTSVNLVLSKI